MAGKPIDQEVETCQDIGDRDVYLECRESRFRNLLSSFRCSSLLAVGRNDLLLRGPTSPRFTLSTGLFRIGFRTSSTHDHGTVVPPLRAARGTGYLAIDARRSDHSYILDGVWVLSRPV